MLKHSTAIDDRSITEIRYALRPTLILLWITWAIVLLGPVAWAILGGFGEGGEGGTYKIPGWCKMASSLILVLVGWTWYAALTADGSKRLARLVALLMTAGIAWGTLGDFFNAGRMQEVIELEDPMIGGLASFLIGHLFYISAFVILARQCEFDSRVKWWVGLGCWELAAIIGWYLIVFRGEGNASLMWAALPYSMLLAGTAGVTTALALHNPRLIWLALGGALFLISDLILGYGIFQQNLWPAGEPVWLTYGPGQMLIVFAIGAMVGLLSEDD